VCLASIPSISLRQTQSHIHLPNLQIITRSQDKFHISLFPCSSIQRSLAHTSSTSFSHAFYRAFCTVNTFLRRNLGFRGDLYSRGSWVHGLRILIPRYSLQFHSHSRSSLQGHSILDAMRFFVSYPSSKPPVTSPTFHPPSSLSSRSFSDYSLSTTS